MKPTLRAKKMVGAEMLCRPSLPISPPVPKLLPIFTTCNYTILLTLLFSFCSVVAQHYDTSVNIEYVIRGNSAILKCQVPSFVADFVDIISWHTDSDETFTPSLHDHGL
jgi:hypothetical protein